ncbi:aspergillopepsin-F [Nannizzia gypsea CBS 118893]|uniref:Aspartic protease pepA n=1 Tax=Arthroderma gypseum (strain ATCC MYA-4604 / CBS 118893) TaxID=535722 RepID=PEPA_ARTGP|nr:aspergillopepsin-F [Nannizzia gypsea CBS 118893]E5R1B9.1 RecName: Full=Aspartic protease pepA; Flags: Precursor [Nannizzia gypsea CBS 118893]EFQ97670.1 aspergillopepsin-F [Nannizzia gypsea CBS 118893]
MVLITQLGAALAVFSALTVAAPTKGKARFSAPQVGIPKKAKHHPAAAYARALHKFGMKIPKAVSDAAKGSVPTTPTQNDEQYVTQVTVGGSTLNLDLDTGSADLWVFSTETPQDESQGHNIYKPSSGAKRLDGYSWEIKYGDSSSAHGDVFLDTVTVGGVTTSSQAVESAKEVSSQFVKDKATDGLMGLSFSVLNTVQPQPQKTFFDNVLSQLEQPLFTCTLKHGEPGTYDFGYIDDSKHTGEIAYTQVDNSNGWWGFTADGYSIGGGSNSSYSLYGAQHKRANGGSISGIADTGTTLMLLSDDVVGDYYQNVQGATQDQMQGGWVFPCDANLPDFILNIGGYNAVVPGKFMNFQEIDNSMCFGGLQSSGGGSTPNIFGDVFLKSQFVVWDTQGPRIGFAPQA